MGKNYDYIVSIDGWSGISRIAGRDLIFGGDPYNGIMNTPSQSITKSADSSARAPATIAISNHFIQSINGRFSDAFNTDPIEGKRLTIREVERPITALSVARVVYIGIVLYTQFDETSCQLICVEESLALSKRIDKTVDTVSFPRAKPADVAASVPVPFGGTVIDCLLPVIEYNQPQGLTEDLDNVVVQFPLDIIDGLSVGAAYIGKELITIDSFGAGPVVNVTRPKPTEHSSGEPVFNQSQFALGIDASDYLSGTVIENVREIDGDVEFPLPLPDSYGLIGSVRAAIWNETPTLDVVSGPKTSVGIEFNTVPAVNPNPPIDALNAAGNAAGYEEKNFAEVAGAGNQDLRLTNTRYIKPVGNINKVLFSIVHSANRPGSALGPANFNIKSNSMPTFQNVAPLNAFDLIDLDFMELAEQKGRRAIEVPVPVTNITTSIFPDSFSNVTGGIGNANPAFPLANLVDGNLNSIAGLSVIFPGPGIGAMTFGFTGVPAGLNPADALVGIRFKFRHGGNLTGNGEVAGFTGTIEMKRAAVSVAGPGVFNSQPAGQVDEVATFVPVETVAAIPLYTGHIALNFGLGGQWECMEGWFEIDTIPVTPADTDTGAVINQFDITQLITANAVNGLSWEEFQSFECSIQGDTINQYKVFHCGLQIIYEPTDLILPETIACNVVPALNGGPFNVIKLLWENAAFGGNPAASFTPQDAPTIATINAFLITHSLIDANVNGLIRDTELIAFIQELVRQTRLFAFVIDTQLNIEIQDDISNLIVPVITLSKDNAVSKPSFQSSDLEQQLINLIDGDYSLSDVKGFNQSITLQDIASVIAFKEQRRKLAFPFLHNASAITAVVNGVFDRNANPYLMIEFKISIDDRDKVNPLTRIALDFDWISIELFEIEELSEAWNHMISIRGRVLIK